MRVIDVDSHFMEPLDWLDQVDPTLAKLIPPSDESFIERVVQGVVGDLLEAIPRKQRPENLIDLLAPSGKRSLQALLAATAEQQKEMLNVPPAGYDGDARVKFCDEHGIDVQFVNSTMGSTPYVLAMKQGRRDLALRAFQAFNTWAAGCFHGHTDRLIPVALIDIADVDWAIAEITRMRGLGSRAFQVRADPVSDTKSFTHPDFDRLWSAAEDLSMTVIFHIGAGRSDVKHGWFFNGGDPSHYAILHLINGQVVPQIALAALVIDGVLERHPRLNVIVEELGIGWIPNLMSMLDSVTVGPYGAQFGIGKGDYKLPLKPSEYIRRQVRFTPLTACDPLQPTMAQLPPELLVFSSDFPHLEGRADAVALCEAQLTDASDRARKQFFGGSIGELLGL
ncbi:MAG TPA: amidohydrolase family protein [Alphaproteobacteria bacterium]|nr:amidohydrolase family protein [Alphaproteobacteria bacterium]